MIAVDAGLLALAANRGAPGHARAAALLESLAGGETPWVLPWSAVHEFLGFVTHRHAVARPLRPADAWAFVEALVRSPQVRLVGPTERHATVAAEVLARFDGGGADTLDRSFELAVVLREHGVREVLSTDPGLGRWTFLEVRDPLEGEPWTPGGPPASRYRTLTRRRTRA